MFARPKKANSRQKLGEQDHSFMKIAKPLVDHSSINDMRANPLFDRPPMMTVAASSSSSDRDNSDKHLPAMQNTNNIGQTKRNNNNNNAAAAAGNTNANANSKQRQGEGVTIRFGHSSGEVDHRPKNLLGMTREEQQEMCSKNREKTDSRIGDTQSFSYNLHGSSYIDKRAAVRMFRVLCIKHPTPNNEGRVVFDPLDGRIFSVSPGFHNRVSHNVLLFDSKKGALSERLPTNQVGASNSGNGRYARILCSFDVWGHIVRRYGGGSSVNCENAKLIQILEFLDPPNPVPKRMVDRYVEPFFFTTADYTEPNRLRSDKHFKINRFFTNN